MWVDILPMIEEQLLGELRIDESDMPCSEIGSHVEHHLDGFFAIRLFGTGTTRNEP